MVTTGATVWLETFVPLMLLNEVIWEATAASVLRTLRRTDNERREATVQVATIARSNTLLVLIFSLYIRLGNK